MALIDLYIASDSISQAKDFYRRFHKMILPILIVLNICITKYTNRKKYEKALTYLEECTDLVDSIVYADNQSKILNIESKYNHLKISKEIDKLKMKQQSYIIVSVICIAALLLMVIGYLLYRKQAKEKILKQQKELDKMKLDLYTLS